MNLFIKSNSITYLFCLAQILGRYPLCRFTFNVYLLFIIIFRTFLWLIWHRYFSFAGGRKKLYPHMDWCSFRQNSILIFLCAGKHFPLLFPLPRLLLHHSSFSSSGSAEGPSSINLNGQQLFISIIWIRLSPRNLFVWCYWLLIVVLDDRNSSLSWLLYVLQ